MALQEELENQGNWLFRYRGTLPLIILLLGYILFTRTRLYPETSFLGESNEIYFGTFCLLVSLFGLAIRVYTVGHTPKNTSGRNISQLADLVNTTGSYSVVRHPLYLGNFFMWAGPALLTGHFWFFIAFCLFFWLYYERIMFAEEQFLRKKFGSAYSGWAQRTPAFIPNFKLYMRPHYSFSWKKVLKKEKNGLAAVFLIFFIFDVTRQIIETDTYHNYGTAILCVLTGILYLVLKYIKKKTRLLDEDDR
ncbi:MAG: lipid A phosphate methyltransferase [Flavobacterium sp.]|nr:MAG: lipid A phosphate methyltransferase [Flavobacterium sp.]